MGAGRVGNCYYSAMPTFRMPGMRKGHYLARLWPLRPVPGPEQQWGRKVLEDNNG